MTLIVLIVRDTNESVWTDKTSYTYYLCLLQILKEKKRSAKTARKQRWSVIVIEINSRIYCGVSFLKARLSTIFKSVID